MRVLCLVIIFQLFFSCHIGKRINKTANELETINQDHVLHMTSLEVISYILVPVEKEKLALAINFDLCEAISPGSFYGGTCKDILIRFLSENQELELEKTLKYGITIIDKDLVDLYINLGRKETIKLFYDENCVPKFNDPMSSVAEMVAALILMNVSMMQNDVSMMQNDYSGVHFILANERDKQCCSDR